MLPKNLHWIVVVILASSGLAVMYLHGKKEDTKSAAEQTAAKKEKEEALRRSKPDVDQLVKEAATQVPPASKGGDARIAAAGQAADPRTAEKIAQSGAQNSGPLRVPALETEQRGRDGISPVAEDSEGRYGKAQTQTVPILVLTGDEAKAQAEKKETAEERLVRTLTENRPLAQTASLAAEDRRILDAAAGSGRAAPTPVAGDEQLQNARRNEQWFRDQTSAADASARRTIGPDPRVSPYTVIQGTAIPAVTVTPVNSDLPGQIVARTTMDIYDSMRGRHLLIPAGSLIYGVYSNAITVGQERLAVVFQRIVLPDGSGVTLGAMPGVDAIGGAGLPGEIDNHFWKIFGSSFLIAGVAALFEPRQNVTNNVYVNGGTQSAMGQVLTDVSRQILSRNTRIPPTVKVGEGQRFNILVQHDLALAPYAGRQ